MGTSHHGPISLILEVIKRTRPDSVLDIGCGSGKWGVLCREYLGKRARIEAIEGWREYLTPLHDTVYDRVHVGDAREIVPALVDSFDVVLLIDVFEHFTPEDGAALLASCERVGRDVLVSVPATWDAQPAINGNEYEIHRAQYTATWFRDRGFQTWRMANHIIALHSPQRLNLRRTLAKWMVSAIAPGLTGAAVGVRDRVLH